MVSEDHLKSQKGITGTWISGLVSRLPDRGEEGARFGSDFMDSGRDRRVWVGLKAEAAK